MDDDPSIEVGYLHCTKTSMPMSHAVRLAPPLAVCCLLSFQMMGQCELVTVGTYSGSPLVGNENTPFPTNTGSNIRRAARTQYIFRAEELTAAGLCPSNIIGLTLEALQGDLTGPGPDGVPGTLDDFVDQCQLRIDVRLGHTAQTSFYDEGTMTPLPMDSAVMTSSNIHTNSGLAMYIAEGPLELTLYPDSFIWNGVDDVVLDISWFRNALNGLSPQLRMDDEVGFMCTRWIQIVDEFALIHGNTLTDNPLPPEASTGIHANRPVIAFRTSDGLSTTIGQMTSSSASFGWDPLASAVVVTRADALDATTITCYDGVGRVLGAQRIPSGVLRTSIPMDHAAPGPIIIQAVAPDGRTLLRGVAIKP